jgi:hypothetical protein
MVGEEAPVWHSSAGGESLAADEARPRGRAHPEQRVCDVALPAEARAFFSDFLASTVLMLAVSAPHALQSTMYPPGTFFT